MNEYQDELLAQYNLMKRDCAWCGYNPKIVIPRMVSKTPPTQHNFHKGSQIDFMPIKEPEWPPDYVSKSGSKYRYTELGIYRTSDHWGDFESISWFFNGKQSLNEGFQTGFARWENIRLFK